MEGGDRLRPDLVNAAGLLSRECGNFLQLSADELEFVYATAKLLRTAVEDERLRRDTAYRETHNQFPL